MSGTQSVRPVLVFAYGNPSRGDDALGPRLIERLEALQREGELSWVDLLTDFQPQVEHALDMEGRELVVFADAAASGPEPFSLEPIQPAQDIGYTTHAMTPGALLRVFEQVNSGEALEARLLAIRGYGFDLGSPISVTARANLEKAIERLLHLLTTSKCRVHPGVDFVRQWT